MVDIEQIFNTLQKEVSHNLSGALLWDDAHSIRWQLDGIQHGHSEEMMEDLASDDVDLIVEVLVEHELGEYVEITDPEFDDTYVYFNIQEL